MSDRADGTPGDGDGVRYIASLVEQSQRGESAAAEELLRRFRPLLARQATGAASLVPAAGVEDLWAQAACYFLCLVAEFDAARGVDFARYAKTKLGWRMANFLRGEARRNGRETSFCGLRAECAEEAPAFEEALRDEGAENAFDQAVSGIICRRALAALPERERQVMAAVARGEAVRDIAAMLGVSSARVVQIKASACRKLRAHWEDVGAERA